jgi:hypothetical protein
VREREGHTEGVRDRDKAELNPTNKVDIYCMYTREGQKERESVR